MTPELVKGSEDSRWLCLRHLLKHPVAFREHFIPQVSKRPYWQRYTFVPALLGIEAGDSMVRAGRGTGKSYAVIEAAVAQPALSRPGEETLLTSFRKVHIVDRMERVIDYYETIPLMRLFLKRIQRAPQYLIELNNDHMIYGLCVDLRAPMIDPITGLPKPLGEISAGDSVTSCGLKDGAPAVVQVADVVRRGSRQVVRVQTESGRSIAVTPDHPLLTDEGWRPAEECCGKRIAIARRMPEPRATVPMTPHQIDLLAIFLAEGTLTSAMPEFFNTDPEIVRRARCGAGEICCRVKRVHCLGRGEGRYTVGPRGLVWKWWEQCGLDRHRAPEKSVPPSVFRLDQAGLARFLSVLWMTDGIVNGMNGPALHMASERIVRQVQHLLLRFGIQSFVVYRANGFRKNGQPQHSWYLGVYSRGWDAFKKHIELWGARAAKLDRLLNKKHRDHGCGWPRATAVAEVLLPAWREMPLRTRTEKLARHLCKQVERLRGPERLRFMKTANSDSISAWAATANVRHDLLPLWTSDSIWWDPVVRVEKDLACEVGDLSVLSYANFIVNDIIVHNSVGDDPEARMAQGKHASRIVVEESHQYPERAFMKLQGAKDPRGSITTMVGVPDGRLDTPFRKADGKYESFLNRSFQISRRTDPFFTQKTKAELASVYGGVDSDQFQQEVDAEWGNPVWSAWDLDAIYRCVEKDLAAVYLGISGKDYRAQALSPRTACADLPIPAIEFRRATIRIAADIGYTQPTMVGVFAFVKDRWWKIARIALTNRMEHDDQALVLAHLVERYNAVDIGIDATEGEGRAIALELEKAGIKTLRYVANEVAVSGYAENPETHEVEEVWDNQRDIGTIVLRRMFGALEFALPPGDDLPSEFNQEMETRDSNGRTRVTTPKTVHIPDMMRVFAVMLFRSNPPAPPLGEQPTEMVLPEWGESKVFRGGR